MKISKCLNLGVVNRYQAILTPSRGYKSNEVDTEIELNKMKKLQVEKSLQNLPYLCKSALRPSTPCFVRISEPESQIFKAAATCKNRQLEKLTQWQQ